MNDLHIDEVKEILGLCRLMRAPEHIFITDESVHDDEGHQFRGLQPVNRRDVIFLSALSDVTTVPHEGWHAMTGLGELTAYPVGRLMGTKANLAKNFPRLSALRLRGSPDYEEVHDSVEFPEAHKYGKRVRHFRRVR